MPFFPQGSYLANSELPLMLMTVFKLGFGLVPLCDSMLDWDR